MIKLAIIIIEHIKLFLHPVIINAFVFYQNNKRIKHENWGDDINYYFLREIIKSPVVLFNRTSLAFRLKLRNYLVIGSTIDMLCTQNTEVWGAGIIDGSKPLKIKPKKVYAVRGPLSRAKLLAEGVDCPEIYGDPAMLVPLYYQPSKQKLYKYGIISHVVNQTVVETLLFNGKPLSECEDVQIIYLGQYKHWHDIIDQICECGIILSSSLHGLIVAEAYHVPNVWIEFGKPLIGGHFKFHDFFLSVQRYGETPLVIANDELPIELINLKASNWRPATIDLYPLINACPFRLREAKYCLLKELEKNI